jgi:hypothetical protein
LNATELGQGVKELRFKLPSLVSGDGRLLYVVGVDGDLVVSSHQVDLGKDRTTRKLVRVVMDMVDGVAVWDSTGVSL